MLGWVDAPTACRPVIVAVSTLQPQLHRPCGRGRPQDFAVLESSCSFSARSPVPLDIALVAVAVAVIIFVLSIPPSSSFNATSESSNDVALQR